MSPLGGVAPEGRGEDVTELRGGEEVLVIVVGEEGDTTLFGKDNQVL